MSGDRLKPSGTINYNYCFKFKDNTEKLFQIALDAKSLRIIRPEGQKQPEWAKLGFHKCHICPLDDAGHPYCPVALNFYVIIDAFGASLSYEEAEVIVEADERTYIKKTSLQRALSSLIGIYMVTSGCPVMDKLKPMVRYHLPFATEDETRYRAIAMYLFAQFFLQRRGIQPDWELKNLLAIYNDVRVVNRSFHKRLMNISVKDANINALVILDCFADYIAFSINKDVLDELETMFGAYFI